MDSKSKLSILSGIIANPKKEIELLKTEIKDAKSDDEMIKKNLDSVSNEFIENRKESLKVADSVIKIDNDILMKKNEYYVNFKNPCHIINNDTSIDEVNCKKLKNMIRENINLFKKIKNNHYSIKKDTNSISIDLKEYNYNSDKRARVRCIVINNIVNRYNRRLHKSSSSSWSKINACTKKDSAIVKNRVDLVQ